MDHPFNGGYSILLLAVRVLEVFLGERPKEDARKTAEQHSGTETKVRRECLNLEWCYGDPVRIL